jgi:hypothetical protein
MPLGDHLTSVVTFLNDKNVITHPTVLMLHFKIKFFTLVEAGAGLRVLSPAMKTVCEAGLSDALKRLQAVANNGDEKHTVTVDAWLRGMLCKGLVLLSASMDPADHAEDVSSALQDLLNVEQVLVAAMDGTDVISSVLTDLTAVVNVLSDGEDPPRTTPSEVDKAIAHLQQSRLSELRTTLQETTMLEKASTFMLRSAKDYAADIKCNTAIGFLKDERLPQFVSASDGTECLHNFLLVRDMSVCAILTESLENVYEGLTDWSEVRREESADCLKEWFELMMQNLGLIDLVLNVNLYEAAEAGDILTKMEEVDGETLSDLRTEMLRVVGSCKPVVETANDEKPFADVLRMCCT